MKLLVLIAVMCVPMLAQEQSSRISDEARIGQIIMEQESAWNEGNAKKYSSRFQEDGSFTIIVGVAYDNRRALEERVAQIFATIFKNSKLSQKINRIRFIRADVAVVDIETEMTGYKNLPPGVKAFSEGKLRTSMLQVMVKEHGDWWIAAFHNIDVKIP
jgi:uncharacterized protein (TIGR02246 family)